jgi:hypothetical protein
MINFSVLQAVLNGPNSLLFLATVGGFWLLAMIHSILSNRRASAYHRGRSELARFSHDDPGGDGRQYSERRRAA